MCKFTLDETVDITLKYSVNHEFKIKEFNWYK